MEERPIRIRTSERSLFRRCRRLWAWQSSNRFNRAVEGVVDHFWFGTGIHFALEDYHGYNYYGDPASSFLAYIEATKAVGQVPATIVELRDLGIGLLQYYSTYWLRNRQSLETYWVNDTPQVEVRFEIELPIKDHLGRPVIYHGTLDRVAIDEYSRLWIVEYKTAKQFQVYHFDVDDQISSYCVPLSTEILTKKGWKRYNDLLVGEEVLGYNQVNKCLEWTILEDIHLPGEQPTVTVSNKSFSFECTEDHKWVKGINQEHTTYVRSERFLEPIKEGQQHHFVVLAASLDSKTVDLSDDEAAVLGWILTDGTWGSYLRGDRASISQKKYVQEVQDLLDRLPNSYSRITEHEGTKTWHLKASFFRNLWERAELGWELENWQAFVLGLSLSARRSFCKAAMLGDGNSNNTAFYQKPGVKHDLFKLAFFLIGVFPSMSKPSGQGNAWSEGIEYFSLTTPHKWTRPIKVTQSSKAKVWCPQTSLRTWVMRQEGQIAITGNCWAASCIYEKPIAGVIYLQFKKRLPEYPRILATGKLSTNKNQSTSAIMYRQALLDIYGEVKKAPGENIRFLNDLIALETQDADQFVRRDFVERNDHQIAAQGEKILLEAEEMINPSLPLYPNPTRDCGWQCALQSVCVAMDDGSDFEGLLASLTIDRQEEDRSWRQYLPHPETIQSPPLQEQLPQGALPDLTEDSLDLSQELERL